MNSSTNFIPTFFRECCQITSAKATRRGFCRRDFLAASPTACGAWGGLGLKTSRACSKKQNKSRSHRYYITNQTNLSESKPIGKMPQFNSKSTADDVVGDLDLKNKVAIVTGANTGIGLVTARAFAKAGATVILACRDMKRGQEALDTIKTATGSDKVELIQLDLGSFENIRSFGNQFKAKNLPLHYLINNAGTYAPAQKRTVDGFEAHLGINHLGPFLLTYLLLDVLKASSPARIVNVSAHSHKMVKAVDYADVNSDKSAFSAVGLSKLFGVWHAAVLHDRLFQSFGVSSFSLHPGLVKTDVFRNSWILGLVAWVGGQTPETGAANTMYVALHADPATQGGEYFDNFKVGSKTNLSADMNEAKRAWIESAKMCGLDLEQVEVTLSAPVGSSSSSSSSK